jgi:hypothetical protein
MGFDSITASLVLDWEGSKRDCILEEKEVVDEAGWLESIALNYFLEPQIMIFLSCIFI